VFLLGFSQAEPFAAKVRAIDRGQMTATNNSPVCALKSPNGSNAKFFVQIAALEREHGLAVDQLGAA
jgi:hypothetical protein